MPQALLLVLALSLPQAAAAPVSRLAFFTPLVGPTWVSTFAEGQVSDTQRFEWMFDRQFVRNTHQVRTPDGRVVYEGETVYAWDARQQRIVWWYWNSTGGHVTGTVEMRADGALVAEGENHGAATQLDRTRVVLRIQDGTWTSQAAQERSGTWTEQPLRTYRPAP